MQSSRKIIRTRAGAGVLSAVMGLALVMGAGAQAAAVVQPGAGKTIFACKTVSGKLVRMSSAGNLMRYSYGKPGLAPELAFAVPLASAVYGGSGPADAGSWWITREVTLSFNGTSYTGHWAYNRGNDSETAGVTVKRGARTLAETACASDIDVSIPETPAEGQ